MPSPAALSPPCHLARDMLQTVASPCATQMQQGRGQHILVDTDHPAPCTRVTAEGLSGTSVPAPCCFHCLPQTTLGHWQPAAVLPGVRGQGSQAALARLEGCCVSTEM